MEQITLEQMAKALAFIVGIGGSILTILKAIKKMFKSLLDAQTKAIVARLDKQEEAISKLDSDNCKNFLVQILSEAERGVALTTEEKIRLSEQFEHYTAAGGNSYIKDWHARLQKEGKI